MDSLRSQTRKSESSVKSRTSDKILKVTTQEDCDNAQYNFECELTNNEEQTINQLNYRNSLAVREKNSQNKFFDVINFDKLGMIII